MRFASFATQLQIRRQKYPSRQAEEANASTSDITQALNSQFPQRNSERSKHKRIFVVSARNLAIRGLQSEHSGTQ